jgi:hypothetical protein
MSTRHSRVAQIGIETRILTRHTFARVSNCPRSARISKQRDDRVRSRSAKLLSFNELQWLGFGRRPEAFVYRIQTLGLRSVWPSTPQRGSGAKLISTQSSPNRVWMQILCRHQSLAYCSSPTTGLTLASEAARRKGAPVGTVEGIAENRLPQRPPPDCISL